MAKKFNITRLAAINNVLALDCIDDDTRAVLENMANQLKKNSATPRKRGKSDARISNEADVMNLVKVIKDGTTEVPADGIGTGFVQSVLPHVQSGQKASAILRAGVSMGALVDITPTDAKKSQPKRFTLAE